MESLRNYVLGFEVPEKLPSTSETPSTALVYEVDLKTDGGVISVKFSRSKKLTNLTPTAFRELCRIVGDGGFPNNYRTNPRHDRNHSRKTPLSVTNNQYAYVIYVLSNRNWQFASKHAPITISKAAYAKPGAYYESKRILLGGATDYGVDEEFGCVAAFIIVDYDKAKDNEGEYRDDINLHVDLVFDEPGEAPMFMPVLIDPDIRFPGGTAP